MSEAITSPTDQWLQYHYQPQNTNEFAVPHVGLTDSISVSSTSFSGTDTMNNVLAPENSCAARNDMSPRASIGKSVRRRSRVSRRTPTTLLNASIKNFRTIVQQHTGCQSLASMKNQKGPINLSFGPSSEQNDFTARNTFGGRYYSGQPQYEEQNQLYHDQEHHIQVYPGQQGLFPSDENNVDLSAFSTTRPNTMTVDNLGWQ